MFAAGILPDGHTLGLGFVLIAGLLGVAVRNYALFHALIEIVTIVATWGVFITAWNSRYVVRNSYLTFIGVTYLFVGLVDLLHILSFVGTGGLQADINVRSQLQIISGSIQAAALLVAPFVAGKKLNTGHAFASFTVVLAAALLSVFYFHNFPDCFLEGAGPTLFSKLASDAVVLLLIASIAAMWLKKPEFDLSAFSALIASIALSALSQTAVSLHASYGWRLEVPSYFLKLIAVYLMYRVCIKTGIFGPFNNIFRNLSLSEKNFFSLLEGLPAFVYVQTPDYRIRYANRVFRSLFGQPGGRTCHEILMGRKTPCHTCPTREIFRTGLPQHREWGIIKNKTYAIFEYPYRDANDSSTILKLGIDITDRKNLETELIAARDELEERVHQRTAELTRANEALQFEVAERERIQQHLENSREELRLLSLKLVHAQEMERKRIAMELHDSLGGSLSAIKFRTEYAMERLGKSVDGKKDTLALLNDIVGMLQGLLEEVRRLHTNIWPSILSDFGLIAAIKWHCRKFVENYPHITIENSLLIDEADAPDILKIVVYRIVQEALNNVAKHSGADLVTIALGKTNGLMELEIRDNGKGFVVSETQDSSESDQGVGLSGMRERARLSGGSIEIRSGKTGTQIRAVWPYAASGRAAASS